MTTEESMQAEHLAIAFECNRQLRAENEALKAASPQVIADTFRECYARSYLMGDEVAKIIHQRFGCGDGNE